MPPVVLRHNVIARSARAPAPRDADADPWAACSAVRAPLPPTSTAPHSAPATPTRSSDQRKRTRHGPRRAAFITSLPNSVWERTAAKLCFAAVPGLETEFRDRRSQTEFGNELYAFSCFRSFAF